MEQDIKTIRKEQPLMVTIRCITYNHEPYIRQCLEGFVMQKTNFRFEAIVHDDASTDGTADIIREYAEKYPDIIKPIYETENQYSKQDGSLRRIMDAHTHGKYVAVCEGDDYWIDPLKLQKQVDFLEENPEYGMCFHNAFVYYVQQQKTKLFNHFVDDCDLSMHDAIHHWYVPTASILVKKEFYYFPKWLARIYCGDYPLIIYACHMGKIRCLHDIMSVYRINTVGTSFSAQIRQKIIFTSEQKISLLKSFDEGTQLKYHAVIESKIEEFQREIKFQKIKNSKNPLRIISSMDLILSRIWIKLKKCYDKLKS